MIRLPVLHEYATVTVDITREQAEKLNATGVVTVVPVQGRQWAVTASSIVGSLVVDDVELLIRPKIRPDNLFLLLEPGLPPHAWREEAFEYGTSGDLLPSVIAFFARTVETTLARGVIRSYRTHDERLVALRGRLDLAGEFRKPGITSPVACIFDEYTEDNPENRYLRAAIRLALRVPRVHPHDRRRLVQQLAALEGVADIGVRADAVDRIHFSRLNSHYRPALNLARLLLANLTLADSRGSTSASTFVVDMNDLFQRFLTRRLRRALEGRLQVVEEPPVHLAEGGQVRMNPDLAFRDYTGATVYVADIKYKVVSDGRARTGDYYQLLAYTTALDLADGMLIYCITDGDTAERTVTVRHSGKRLRFYGIDLSGDANEVAGQIDGVAAEIVRSASRINAVR